MGVCGSFSHVCIRGIASAVPERCVANSEYLEPLGEKDLAKFEKMTGIKSRHHAQKLTTSDLAEAAARELQKAGLWSPETIDACIFVSQTPDVTLPATACMLHGRLGLKKECLAFDLGLGCSGFVYGAYVAGAMIESGRALRRVLLLGGDTISKVAAQDDAANQMLFGDAGFATVLEYAEEASSMQWLFGSDGSGANAIVARGSSSWQTLAHLTNVKDCATLQMDGLEVFNFTIREIPNAIHEFCANHNVALADIEHFCFHQANRFILKQIAMTTGFPNSRHLISIDQYGNTSSASIPLTLCHNLLRGGALLAGFGVGLSWGLLKYDFSKTDLLPVVIVKEPLDA